MCSPSWTPLPLPFPSHPSGLSQCSGPERPVPCVEPGLVVCFTYGNIHVSVLFSQIISLLSREFHGQRSLAGCSQWAYEESDTAERLILTIMNYWKMTSSFNMYCRISTMIHPSGEILGTAENRVNPASTCHLELGVQRQRPLEISIHFEGILQRLMDLGCLETNHKVSWKLRALWEWAR